MVLTGNGGVRSSCIAKRGYSMTTRFATAAKENRPVQIRRITLNEKLLREPHTGNRYVGFEVAGDGNRAN